MTQRPARIENNQKTVWTGPTVQGFPAVTLGPGAGKIVDQSYLDAWGNLSPGVQEVLKAMLRKGLISVIPSDSPQIAEALSRPESPKAPPNLLGQNEAMALLFVKDEGNPDILRNWLDDERREEVRKAINAKLNKFPAQPVVTAQELPGSWQLPTTKAAPPAPEPQAPVALPVAGPTVPVVGPSAPNPLVTPLKLPG
jgi:hypothetical protein